MRPLLASVVGSTVIAAAAALAAVGLLAGCGGSGQGDGGGMMGGGGMMRNGSGMPMGSQPGSVPVATTGGASAAGRALFVSNCGGCHTLAAAGTSGGAGPNLDQARPSYERVVRQVADGGGGMPGFAGSLSQAQIDAIARYVAGSTR